MKPSLFLLLTFLILEVKAKEPILSYLSNECPETNQPHFLSQKRVKTLLISEASIYAISLIGLNQLWYSGYPRSRFHFINDNREWMQMDKLGHMTTSYYGGVAGIKAYRWAGFERKKAIWYGGMTGSFFLSIIEFLDGTSKEWGASLGDLLSNTAGSLMAIGQELSWNEQRILLKYSYSPTKYAKLNPEQLGSNYLERPLKDYNGQTYWLSLNIKSLFLTDYRNFPAWLNIAVGHGADKMSQPYPQFLNTSENDFERQFYMSFDIDLNKIKTKNQFVNSVLHFFGFIKFPAPTIEINNGKLIFDPSYFS